MIHTVSDYLYVKASQLKIPLAGTFELSPVCNFSCKMCYVRKTMGQIQAEGKRLRTAREWLELARECKEAGMLFLLLTGGEPFLYPGFKELYIQLHKMGFIININTNGTMIDEATVAWLKEYAPSRINITLYGASEETYGRICGNPGGYKRAIRAVEMLLEAGIPVVMNASMIPENAQDMGKIWEIGRGYGINTRIATYMFPPSRREAEQTDSRFTPMESARLFMEKLRWQAGERYLELLRQKAESVCLEGEADWGVSQEPDAMRCRAGRCTCWIAWDGTMTACGMMDFPRREYPFEDGFALCWKRLNEAVRSASVLSGCSGCPHKELCNPCVAMLVTEAGDPNQKAPYLCHMTRCIREIIDEELEKYDHEKE